MNPKQSYELDVLFDNGPGSVKNAMLIFSTRVLAKIMGVLSFLLGISFLSNSFREWINSDFTIVPEFFGETAASGTKGIFLIALSACLFLIVLLCKMILRRNKFALDLFAWHENLKSEVHQKKL